MGQISLYMNDQEMNEVRAKASKQGMTISRYVAKALRDSSAQSTWPTSFFSLYGALGEDDTFVEPPDEPFNSNPIPTLN